MLSAVNGTLFGFGLMFGGSSGPCVERRRIAALRYVARGATDRAVFESDFSMAFPRSGVARDGEAGDPAWTIPAGCGADAFSGAFFFVESPPLMSSEVPTRSAIGINIDCAV